MGGGGLEILMFMTCLRLLIQIIDSNDHLNKGQSLLEGGGGGGSAITSIDPIFYSKLTVGAQRHFSSRFKSGSLNHLM